MTSSNIVSVTKHKYKWKPQEIFSIVLFAVVPIALWFLTNPTLTASLGTICGAIALFLIYIGFARKKASELTANIFDDGSVQVLGKVTGQDYEENNRVVLKDVTTIKWEKYAHHPTLRLSTGNGPSLFLPRRVAEEEPLNSFIRENLPKKVYVVEEARATLNEILEDSDSVTVSDKNTVSSENAPVTAAVSLSEIKDAEEALGFDQASVDAEKAAAESRPSVSPASDLSNLNGLFGSDGGVKFDAVTQTPLHDGTGDEDEMRIVLESPIAGAERKVQPRKRSRPQKKD